MPVEQPCLINCPELNCPDKGMFSPVFTDSCKNAGFLASHYQCRLVAPCWSNKNKQMMDFPGSSPTGLEANIVGERLVKWILHNTELFLNLNRSQVFSSDTKGIFFIVMKIHLSSLSLYFESIINFEQSLFKVRLRYCVCVSVCGLLSFLPM